MGWFGQGVQQVRGRSEVWIRDVEHGVLRVVSLAFSLGSAHAIRWFFSPLDSVDRLEVFITWTVAIGFGALGYFVSRGLAHRLMNKESVWAYLPICLVVEFVEIFCNYALAAATIANAHWLGAVPYGQRVVLETMTYMALSIIPLVSLLLAVVDMDLERKRHQRVDGPTRGGPLSGGGAYYQPSQGPGPRPSPVSGATGPSSWTGGHPQAAYTKGYTGNRGATTTASVSKPANVPSPMEPLAPLA